MTTPADDSAVEEAFEALLAGRAVPEEAAGLAAFAGAVRSSATQPGRPNAALAELLATGLLTDQSSPSTRTAVAAGDLPSRRPRVRRRRFAMIFPVLLAKFLSAGAIAQGATGAGIVVVAFTGAGATGVLGADVQATIATVVGASDEATPDGTAVAGGGATPTDTGTTEPPTVEITVPVVTAAPVDPGAFDVKAWAEDGPDVNQSFGDWVREAAREGKADGKVISEWAHRKGEDADDYPTGSPTPTTAAPTTGTEQEDRHEVEDPEVAYGDGHGHGGGKNGHSTSGDGNDRGGNDRGGNHHGGNGRD